MHCSKDLLDIILLTIFSELVVTTHELEAVCHSVAYKTVMTRMVKKQVKTVLATLLR